ncbi:hypothetical protein I2483_00460 [Sporosarcina sp. E16_3]|uniref:hypothetical protein n=1 Tax=Sporosarcina sp. E16_3 TaxID=2789293 RepID=UPI001A927DA9|nr:hypothetical protein [Sporosarcina sp. E16_3]MBO0600122.1 hypothetical protein [Sporosarcina sp. E16_3]
MANSKFVWLDLMKVLWLIVSLIPAPFLFHYYEYGQHMKHEEATFLLASSILYVVVSGLLSGAVKLRFIFCVNIITGVLSVFLATNFIVDEGGWFKPVGRDGAVIFVTFVFFTGQLLVRLFLRAFFVKNNA